MSVPGAFGTIDNDVRLFIYREFIAHGAPPSPADTALALRMGESDVAAAYQRLADAHVIVLRPGSREVLMAAPLSAVPTRFRVTAAKRPCAVRQLHLGRPRYSRDVASGCDDRRTLRRLRRAVDVDRRQGPPGAIVMRRALRRSRRALVGGHRLHVKHHAPLPVGRTRRQVVRREPSAARGSVHGAADVDRRRGVVPSPPRPRLASPHAGRSAGPVRARRSQRGFLAPVTA